MSANGGLIPENRVADAALTEGTRAMGRARATLRDIAAASGFSANTVSLALRGSPRLPDRTREIILKEAQRLNYFPNRIAQSLASRATRTIGLVMTDIMNPTLTLAAHTIERELTRAGYAVMFAATDSSVEREQRAMELFLSYQVDGMLVYPADRREIGHIRAIDAAGTPVLLLVDIPDAGIDVVTIDDRLGAYFAVRHLCAAGHRRFAMLDGGRKIGSEKKWQGAVQAVTEAGLAADCLTVLEPDGHRAADGYGLMPRVLALDPGPTAVFCTTDSLALGVLHWCREHGLSVPGDLAVAGYDNTEIAAYGAVPLTTVNYAADEISRIGVSRIVSRIECPEAWHGPETHLIEPQLVVRDTV